MKENEEAKVFYERQIEEEKAIEYAKEWVVKRKWLIQIGAKFDHFPEEIKFQKLNNEFQLIKKAKIQRLSSTVDLLSRR